MKFVSTHVLEGYVRMFVGVCMCWCVMCSGCGCCAQCSHQTMLGIGHTVYCTVAFMLLQLFVCVRMYVCFVVCEVCTQDLPDIAIHPSCSPPGISHNYPTLHWLSLLQPSMRGGGPNSHSFWQRQTKRYVHAQTTQWFGFSTMRNLITVLYAYTLTTYIHTCRCIYVRMYCMYCTAWLSMSSLCNL